MADMLVPDKNKRQYYDRYKAGVLTEDGFLIWENWDLPKLSSDQFYEVKAGTQRLDLISQKFYQTPNLWWLLALANDITDPWKEIEVGTVLRIPDVNELQRRRYFEGEGV